MKVILSIFLAIFLPRPLYSQIGDAMKSIDLPVDAEFSKPIADACQGRFELRVFINEQGDIFIETTSKSVLTRNHRSTNLPARPDKIMDWHARFRVVPKLNQSDAKLIQERVEYAANQKEKSDWVLNHSFLEKLPNIESEKYAYSLGTSYSVPVMDKDRSLVREFIEELAKNLRTEDGSDPRALLKHLLLDER